MKVWIATSGSYSEYGVDAVCATREIAAEIGDNEPEEFELLTELPIRRSYRQLHTTLKWVEHPASSRVHAGDAGPHCPDCVLVVDRPWDRTHVFWPWDEYAVSRATERPRVDITPRLRYPGLNYRMVTVTGSNPLAVQVAFDDAVGRVKAEMEGIA